MFKILPISAHRFTQIEIFTSYFATWDDTLNSIVTFLGWWRHWKQYANFPRST